MDQSLALCLGTKSALALLVPQLFLTHCLSLLPQVNLIKINKKYVYLFAASAVPVTAYRNPLNSMHIFFIKGGY